MTTRLQLSLNAKDLTNLGGLFGGKSDPFAVVTIRGDNPDNRPQVVGQTDVVFNNLNPSWSRIVFLDGYKFGVPFYIEVGVFDFDAKQAGQSEKYLSNLDAFSNINITGNASSRNLLRNGKFPHKVMGTALFEVGEILGSRGNVGSKSLQTGGAVYAHIERSREDGTKGKLRFQLKGVKLVNTQNLGKRSSPFYELYRKVDRPTGATWSSVYRSNVLRSNLNPEWDEVSLDLEVLCNGDVGRSIKVIVWDHRRTGKHKMMGEFETTVTGLLDAKLERADQESSDFGFSLEKHEKTMGTMVVVQAVMDEKPGASKAPPPPKEQDSAPPRHVSQPIVSRQKSKPQSPARGRHSLSQPTAKPQDVIPTNIRVADRPEFVDYLTGGCQISLAVAIDFTASNGDPRQEGTPHYFHPPASKEWNDYEKAIFAVGSILAKYDSDQRFPVWGFGAKYNDVVRHCFQCGSEIEVQGVQGIMDAYRGVFRTPLTMSYPTKFTEVISTAASYARHEQEVAEQEGQLSYTILLILTAGNVENVKETKQHLINACNAPLSVVIVGIGDADFRGMEFLDEHDPTTEEGRDITKFVRFSDYNSYNALTEAVLDEIPDQLVDYYFERGIMPGSLGDFDINDVDTAPADDDERTLTFLG